MADSVKLHLKLRQIVLSGFEHLWRHMWIARSEVAEHRRFQRPF